MSRSIIRHAALRFETAGGRGDARTDLAAELLASAFADDPMFTSALPDRVGRLAGLPLLWRSMIRQFLPAGRLEIAERDGRPVGAILLGDGQASQIGWVETVRYGFVRFGLAAGVPQALGLMRLQTHMDRVHHEIISEPHVYVAGLGVRPSDQRRGAGSELLDRVLAWVDEQGLPAYLETNLAVNAALYRTKGFRVVREQEAHGFHTWFMLRPAC